MRAAMRRLRWVAMGLTTTLCLVGTAAAQTENGEWRSYSGDQGSTKYAPLDQINRTNVKNLRIAWRRPAVDPLLSGKDPKLQVPNNFRATPLMIGGVLYAPNGVGLVEAFDPGTGKTIWIQEPPPGPDALRGTSTRGVAYWREAGDERIFVQRGEMLIALNAKTGQPYATFGVGGAVNLHLGSDKEPYSWSGAPRVCRDVVIVGASMSDSPPRKEGTPGDVRGYDVRTGNSAGPFMWFRAPASLVSIRGRTTRGSTRTYESVVPHQCRRTTRIRVSAAHESDKRYVRGPSTRRQSIFGRAGQHRVPDRETRVALPTRASRLVGLRFASRADSGGHHSRWPSDPVRRAADETGVCLRVRPGYGPAGVADRRSSCAAVEDAR